MPFIHLSIAFRVSIVVSLYIDTFHVPNVLSPATLNCLPLKGTLITANSDAGNCAALQRKDVSSTSPSAYAGKLTVALNRLGRAPPPRIFDLKSSTPRIAIFYSPFLNRANNFSKIYTCSNRNIVKCYEVNRTSWFYKNVSYEFISINNGCSIVSGITD